MNDQFTTIQFLRDSVANFNASREWQEYHSPRNLAESICIESAELLQCFQWGPDWPQRGSIVPELTDVIIYCLSFANVCEIDITTAVLEKLQKNGEKYPAE